MRTGKHELMAWMERAEKINNAFLRLEGDLAEINLLHPIRQDNEGKLLVEFG